MRYSVRSLLRSPGFSASVIGMLAEQLVQLLLLRPNNIPNAEFPYIDCRFLHARAFRSTEDPGDRHPDRAWRGSTGRAALVLVYAVCSRYLAPLLYGVRALEVPLLAAVAFIAVVAFVSCVVPTRRAVAIHPAEALREE